MSDSTVSRTKLGKFECACLYAACTLPFPWVFNLCFINSTLSEKLCVTDTQLYLKLYTFSLLSTIWFILNIFNNFRLHRPICNWALLIRIFETYQLYIAPCNNNEMIRWMTSLFHVLSDIVTSLEDASGSSNCPWYYSDTDNMDQHWQ